MSGMGGMSGASGMSGGMSSSSISATGRLNTNGPNATDRDFGRDRAEDRRATAAGRFGVNASARSNLNGRHHRFGRLNRRFDTDQDRDFGRDRGRDRDRDNGRDIR